MENNAKHFALQLGALISLYVSVGSLISLLFGIITIAYPDPTNSWEYVGATGSIRWAIALLVVFFPAYIALTRIVNQERRGTGVPYLGITKWLIYLSLVVGGVALLADFVAVIYNFLNGELTTRFLLKAVAMFVVVGLPCAYYLYDTRGYWISHEARSKQYGALVAVLVLVAIGVGYTHIETPSEVRELRRDSQTISDLGTIQSHLENAYALSNTLPESLDTLEERVTIPVAPEGRPAYEYKKTGANTFELCATFAQPSRPEEISQFMGMSEVGVKNPYDWTHKEGRTCFPRVMNEPVMNPQIVR
jgi:hypothetical protein